MNEIVPMIDFLFLADAPMDDAAFAKAIGTDATARAVLSELADECASVGWTKDALHELVVAVGERHEWNLRKTQAPVRCAVTGRLVGPPLFESLEILGRDESIRRIRSALSR
jgi:glutamyl-tRNA synthetase